MKIVVRLSNGSMSHELTCCILLDAQYLRTKVQHTLVYRTFCCSEILRHVVDMHGESLHLFTCTNN